MCLIRCFHCWVLYEACFASHFVYGSVGLNYVRTVLLVVPKGESQDLGANDWWELSTVTGHEVLDLVP